MESSRPTALLHQESEPHHEARALVRHLLDTGVRADPYPVLNRIRECGPVWMHESTVVFASRAHCEAVLRAPSARTGRGPACPAAHAPAHRAGSFPLPDSADHTGLRRLISVHLAPHAVQSLVPAIEDLTDDRLDSVAARGRLEVVTDLAYPLAAAALSLLLDIPAGDEHTLHKHSLALSPALDPLQDLLGTRPPGMDERRLAEEELDAYFAELARTRQANPGDDLLSALLCAPVNGRRATPAEAAAVCRSLFGAGHETTVDLISNTLLALLRSARQLDAIRANADHARHVVEEVLRMDPPVQVIHRYAQTDLDICGTRVPRGAAMLLLLPAAHRDPALLSSPNTFAPGEDVVPHLAFGLGAHSCPGASLARLVARVVATRFAQRVTGARFAVGKPSYRPNVTLRGLRALWVDADSFGTRGTAAR